MQIAVKKCKSNLLEVELTLKVIIINLCCNNLLCHISNTAYSLIFFHGLHKTFTPPLKGKDYYTVESNK